MLMLTYLIVVAPGVNSGHNHPPTAETPTHWNSPYLPLPLLLLRNRVLLLLLPRLLLELLRGLGLALLMLLLLLRSRVLLLPRGFASLTTLIFLSPFLLFFGANIW